MITANVFHVRQLSRHKFNSNLIIEILCGTITLAAASCILRTTAPGTVSAQSKSLSSKYKPKNIWNLVWLSTGPPMLVAQADGFVLGSTDDGVTWHRLDSGNEFGGESIRGIESDLSGGVIARTNSGYFERSSSDGLWRRLLPNLPFKTMLWFVPGNRAHMYARRTDNFLKPGDNDALLATTDGGQSWTEVQMPGGQVPFSLAVAPQDHNVLYASTTDLPRPIRVWRSLDAARTWELIDTVKWTLLNACDFIFDPRDINTVFNVVRGVGIERTGDSLRKTVDGGTTWRPVELKSLVFAPILLPTRPPTLITGAYYNTSNYSSLAMLASKDGGEHWTRIGKGLPEDEYIKVIVKDPSRLNVLFAGTQTRGIYRSTDGGATWVRSSHKP